MDLARQLTDAQWSEIRRAALAYRARSRAQSVWTPHPDNRPQRAAIESDADELLYGGAAGGGKTDTLLGLALTRHRCSIIYRREYPQLAGIRRRLVELTDGTATTNWQAQTLTTSDGRIIELGAVQYEEDVARYQGRPHDLVAFDEITHFTESQYRYLIAWNRSTTVGQRCRIVCAGNPPVGYDGRWVVQYWAPWLDPDCPHPAAPGELRWYIPSDNGTVVVPAAGEYRSVIDGESRAVRARSRSFIPARVGDNPYLAGTGYESVLQSLDPTIRRALLDGSFAAPATDNPWQVITTAAVDRAFDRVPPVVRQPISSVGVDVARGGGDKTVIAVRRGLAIEIYPYPGSETPTGDAVAELTIRHMDGDYLPPIGFDVIGVGAAVLDAMRIRGLNAVPLSGGKTSTETDKSGKLRYRNQRSQWYWQFREALDDYQIVLPSGSELRADLCAARYEVVGDKIVVEPKEHIKKRLGRSPDLSDAVVYSWAVGPRQVALAGTTEALVDVSIPVAQF